VLVAGVYLHRSCGLRTLIPESNIKLADVLYVSAVLAGKDEFRDSTDFVHDSSLLSSSEWDTIPIVTFTVHCTVKRFCILS